MEQKRGQQARAGELLAVLQDTSRLRVEVAAEDSAAADVQPGMKVNVRLYALTGRLLTGTVLRVAHTAEQDRTIGVTPVRTDSELYQEQIVNARAKSGTSYHVRVYVELDEALPELKPEMTGYARIVVKDEDVLWRALVRPVARFLRTEVWSWLP
jgi:multidrug efflux pump subunit AcrA (membrane-fusion protein)